jgi:hypothetical protein
MSTVPYVNSTSKGSCVSFRTYTNISVLHSGIEMSYAKKNQAGARIFLFFTVPGLVLGHNQPPIRWVPATLFPEVYGWSVKLATHLHLILMLRKH